MQQIRRCVCSTHINTNCSAGCLMGTASIRPCYEADRFPAVFEDVAAAVGRCPPLTRKRLMVLVKANDRNRRHRSTTIAGCNLYDLGAIVPPHQVPGADHAPHGGVGARRGAGTAARGPAQRGGGGAPGGHPPRGPRPAAAGAAPAPRAGRHPGRGPPGILTRYPTAADPSHASRRLCSARGGV